MHMEVRHPNAAGKYSPAVKPSTLWAMTFALAALFLATRSARAQHGFGFHPNVIQQGGRGPRLAPPPPPSGPQSQGGNSMFPITPSGRGGRNHLQAGPTGRWWDDRRLAANVGLRLDQKVRMDAIFSANKPAIVAAYENLLKEEKKFNALSHQAQPDKAQMFASIDAVNGARTALEKATDKMLLEIRAELDDSQLARLQAMR